LTHQHRYPDREASSQPGSNQAAHGPTTRHLFCLVLLGIGIAGCPEQVSKDAPGSAAPCKELGQNCEVSPGKLGSCVVVDNCREGNCFVCQSQH
jgi:hypothetical protein